MFSTGCIFLTNPGFLQVPMVHKANSRKHLLQCLSRTGDCLKMVRSAVCIWIKKLYIYIYIRIYIYTWQPPVTYLEAFSYFPNSFGLPRNPDLESKKFFLECWTFDLGYRYMCSPPRPIPYEMETSIPLKMP